MTDDIVTRTFEFTAEGMWMPPKRTFWQWLRDVLLRRPKPQPVAPEGTNPLVVDVVDGDRHLRFYYPAARITEVNQPET